MVEKAYLRRVNFKFFFYFLKLHFKLTLYSVGPGVGQLNTYFRNFFNLKAFAALTIQKKYGMSLISCSFTMLMII
jgi:hypothetical protein